MHDDARLYPVFNLFVGPHTQTTKPSYKQYSTKWSDDDDGDVQQVAISYLSFGF